MLTNKYHLINNLPIFFTIIISISGIFGSFYLPALTISIVNATQDQINTSTLTPIQIQNTKIPSAESVYNNQSISLPSSVKTFVWYITDEAHENLDKGIHKHISDHNPVYLPTHLMINQGTSIVFLDADAPWDSPRPHTIDILDNSGKTVYTTGKLDYTNSSKPVTLPAGDYSITDTKYQWMKGQVTVEPSKQNISESSNLIIGGFYTPTNQVADKKDNDGGIHPGWLGYYKSQFPINGFNILSSFDFHYAACNYCPGGFWPDQKTGDHTMIIYSTNQNISTALDKLAKFVWNNPYI